MLEMFTFRLAYLLNPKNMASLMRWQIKISENNFENDLNASLNVGNVYFPFSLFAEPQEHG